MRKSDPKCVLEIRWKLQGKFHGDGTLLTETSFLNRVIRWAPGGTEMEGAAKHVTMVLRDL